MPTLYIFLIFYQGKCLLFYALNFIVLMLKEVRFYFFFSMNYIDLPPYSIRDFSFQNISRFPIFLRSSWCRGKFVDRNSSIIFASIFKSFSDMVFFFVGVQNYDIMINYPLHLSNFIVLHYLCFIKPIELIILNYFH